MMPLSQLSEDNLLDLFQAIIAQPGHITAQDLLDLALIDEEMQRRLKDQFGELMSLPGGNA